MDIRFVSIKSDNNIIKSDFLISKYPVTIKDFHEIVEGKSGDPEQGKYKKMATWTDAVKFCNHLSLKKGLPLSYDESAGKLVDENGICIQPEWEPGILGVKFRPVRVKGFRLPTFYEWEYAAKGWTPVKRCDCYYRILENTFKYYDLNHDIFLYGQSDLQAMEVNTNGLFGMLGNAREWYSDNELPLHCPETALKNKLCYWEEYYYNYDNAIAYQLQKKLCDDTDMFGFRVAITCQENMSI